MWFLSWFQIPKTQTSRFNGRHKNVISLLGSLRKKLIRLKSVNKLMSGILTTFGALAQSKWWWSLSRMSLSSQCIMRAGICGTMNSCLWIVLESLGSVSTQVGTTCQNTRWSKRTWRDRCKPLLSTVSLRSPTSLEGIRKRSLLRILQTWLRTRDAATRIQHLGMDWKIG